MKKPLFVSIAVAALVLTQASTEVSAEEKWKTLKRESKRMKIDETAQDALDTLFASSPKAEDLFLTSTILVFCLGAFMSTQF